MAQATDHPTMTRRALLRGSVTAGGFAAACHPLPALASNSDAELISMFWEWAKERDRLERLYVQRDHIHDDLPEGDAQARVLGHIHKPFPESRISRSIYVTSEEGIHSVLDEWCPELTGLERAARFAAIAEKLAEEERRIDAVYERAGLNALDEQIDECHSRISPIEDAVRAARTSAPVARTVKLLIGLNAVTGLDMWDDDPWCTIRSILLDAAPHIPSDLRRSVIVATSNKRVGLGIGEMIAAAAEGGAA